MIPASGCGYIAVGGWRGEGKLTNTLPDLFRAKASSEALERTCVHMDA
jgi:hypothetical protein